MHPFIILSNNEYTIRNTKDNNFLNHYCFNTTLYAYETSE